MLRLTLVLVLAVCSESSSQRAARIRTGVIGLSGRDIISGMGPPEDSECADSRPGAGLSRE